MKSAKHVLKNNRGKAVSGKCQYPLCCNFFSLEHSNRKYCRAHKRIPDTIKGSVISRTVKEDGDWVITTVISLKRKQRK